MQQKEIELKFKIDDLEAMRKKLLDLGASDQGRVLEHNEKFDNQERLMGKKGHLLRLRKDKKNRLTLKVFIAAGQFKEVEEREVEVSDFQVTKNILQEIGYQVVWIYEKYRQTYDYKNTEVVIDELPIGENYLEIEGEEKDILCVIKDLGLDIKDSSTKTYVQVYREYCKRNRVEGGDMVFKERKNL